MRGRKDGTALSRALLCTDAQLSSLHVLATITASQGAGRFYYSDQINENLSSWRFGDSWGGVGLKSLLFLHPAASLRSFLGTTLDSCLGSMAEISRCGRA